MDNIEKFGITNSERTKCEVWTRVMGYHRPISSFNVGKKRRSRGEEIFLNKEELCQLQEINFAPLCRGNFFCSLPYFIRVSVWQNIWQFIYSICKVT
ncbi:hypothetical protein [uncultured Parasutterella sp.]|uniref:hypothetical protein n=1 Tax=uncultured Parasutterella sp. TaxID=1263098 RepID=UPI00258504EE|nr:hypothetical protein [uncultured Parasutterella sp.]